MTTRAPEPVRLHGAVSSQTPGVARTVEAAWSLLAAAGRIVRVPDPRLAETVHTVGAVRPPQPAPGRRGPAPRSVHTVDRIPLRADGITPDRRWLTEQRRLTAPTAGWLVHGSTAARVVVTSGLAAGVGVTCLPVLEPARPHGAAPGPVTGPARAALRHRWGLAPGVRLVVDAASASDWDRREVLRWPEHLHRRGRHDVVVGHLRTTVAGGTASCLQLGPSGPVFPVDVRDVLSIADVFVAVDGALKVCNVATVAAAAGTPIVAVTTDSAVDLVTPGRNGYVVPPRPDEVAHAVLSQVDVRRGSHARPSAPQVGPVAPDLVFARLLLGIYLRVRYGRLGVVA